jgi:isoleucyl-tRNA synthetase
MFCSLVATDRTCSKAFLTHGFVVDKDGRKMSKSVGNGVEPQEIISQYNADVLRMWVRGACSPLPTRWGSLRRR